jgi:hypothetical protein
MGVFQGEFRRGPQVLTGTLQFPSVLLTMPHHMKMPTAFQTAKNQTPKKPNLIEDDRRRRDRRGPISRIERAVDRVTKDDLPARKQTKQTAKD